MVLLLFVTPVLLLLLLMTATAIPLPCSIDLRRDHDDTRRADIRLVTLILMYV